MRDPPPTLGTFLCRLGQVLLRPLSNHWSDGGHAKFGGFLNGPLHVIKLVNGHYQGNGQCGIGLNLRDQVEADLIR